MKKKLNLDLLKVESFVTSLNLSVSNTIAGGARRQSGNCSYDSEINEGEGCVKSAFSDCALPMRRK